VDGEVSPPFGAYAPTPTQARILRWFHDTPLGSTRLRRPAIRRFQTDRPGPVDAGLFGLRVRFHPQDNTSDAKAVVCGRRFNRTELRWLADSLKPGGTFVDVGANMGFFSLFAASRGARVLAIEPSPVLFERLRVNMALNAFEDAVLVRAAAGETEGEVSFEVNPADLGTNRVSEGGGETVPQRPLLSMVEEAGFAAIDVLKIDIEGYEDRALVPFFRDAPEALYPRRLLMEMSSGHDWVHDLNCVLGRAGYRVRAETRGNSLLERV
jgi:FkbM family methyltransferase